MTDLIESAHRGIGMIYRCRLLLILFFAFLLATTPSVTRAGGGPENVFLVVNPLSPDSLAIANYYSQLRQIPGINVFRLAWGGSRESIPVETFRQQILEPIMNEIGRRRLESQIDYIVYSSGFPYAVDFSADIRSTLPRVSGRQGSITGLTFFQEQVRSRDTSYVYTSQSQRANHYESTRTRGFRSQYGWNPRGQRVGLNGSNYYLSMMLGYTDGRGNSLPEVVQYLRRSVLADCTQPQGTIYLMRVQNEVRSQTRDSAFSEVARTLNDMGVKAEVMDGVLPMGRPDVLGVVTGRAKYDWSKTRSTIQPGAICENLTSFGGILRSNATQTPLTEFLRYGAAASSGTVVEPFALQAKFPHPWVQVHYARGATVAEAFYQAVASPYQLLMVGDPLCRPWASAPNFTIDGPLPNSTVSGTINLRPVATSARIREFQLFVNGRFRRVCQPGDSFELNTVDIADGYQEMRIVAIEDSEIESQSRLILPLNVANRGMKIEWGIQPKTIYDNSRIQLLLTGKGTKAIHVFHEREPLGTVNLAMGQVTIDASKLGVGPVTLTAIGIGEDPAEKVYAAPIQFVVRPRDELSGIGVN